MPKITKEEFWRIVRNAADEKIDDAYVCLGIGTADLCDGVECDTCPYGVKNE